MLIVENALEDRRFATNPLVTGAPFVRFYAGVVLHGPDRLPLGTLCLIAPEPRGFDAAAQEILAQLGALVEDELLPDSDPMRHRLRSQLDARLDPLTRALAAPRFMADAEARLGIGDPGQTSLALITVTGLDRLNDIFGRSVGDEVLLELAARLRRIGEGYGAHLLGRLSGRRFALQLEGTAALGTGADASRDSRVRSGRAVPRRTAGIAPRTCAWGSPREGKRRNGWSLCSSAAAPRWRARRRAAGCRSRATTSPIRSRCDGACASPPSFRARSRGDALHLVYQPKVRCLDRRIDGFECLLRWQHDELDRVSPLEILEVAQDINRLVTPRSLGDRTRAPGACRVAIAGAADRCAVGQRHRRHAALRRGSWSG